MAFSNIFRKRSTHITTVLRQSAEYQVKHVEWLRSQIRDVEVFTISDVGIINRIVMKYDWPGWWAKMELFRPDIPGDIFYLDIDTVVLGDIRPFMRMNKTTLLTDFYRPAGLQSSMMYLTEADRAKVWEAWIRDPVGYMRRFGRRQLGLNGDQNFLEEVLGLDVQRWHQVFPGRIVSWKVDVNSGKARSSPMPDIMVFHGSPRPWEVGYV